MWKIRDKKGQMSLEMIIGLVILLVLATVVVSLFLNTFQDPSQGETAISRSEISQQCSSLCQSYQEAQTTESTLSAALAYCTETFVFDENGDGVTTDTVEQGYNSYCEDNVYCFNMESCSRAGEELDASGCQELLEDYYAQVQGAADPGDRVNQLYQADDGGNLGSCDLTSLTDPAGNDLSTWFTDNFGSSP